MNPGARDAFLASGAQQGRATVLPAGCAAGEPRRPFLAGCAGTSMAPTLDGRDLLEVVPYGAAPPRVGDVVWLATALGAVIHRVVAVRGERVVTRGDNNRRRDTLLVTRAEVVGRVVTAWRGARRREVAGGRRELLRRLAGREWRALAARLGARAESRPLRPGLPATVVAAGGGAGLLYLGDTLAGCFDPRSERWQLASWVASELAAVPPPPAPVSSPLRR